MKANGGGSVFCYDAATDGGCDGTTFYPTQVAAEAGDGTDGIYATEQDGFDALADTGGSCTYYYTAQWKTPDDALDGTIAVDGDVLGLETLTYTIGTGSLTRSLSAYQP